MAKVPDSTADLYLNPEMAKIQAALRDQAPPPPLKEQTVTTPAKPTKFPFTLDELAYWVIKRKDGTLVKYLLVDNAAQVPGAARPTSVPSTAPYQSPYYSLGDFCHHNPTPEPVFRGEGVELFIADAPGCRAHWTEFDYVIDGGDVLSLYDTTKRVLMGDPGLCEGLNKYVTVPQSAPPSLTCKTKVLKIDWFDRAAPRLDVAFWEAFLGQVKAPAGKPPSRVLCVCQGGHGRSGTQLVSLMMCMTDYTPLDAITHLRAIHCPRAIESKVQHEYLNHLAVHLKRTPNALEAEGVASFKDRFLSLTSETSRPYRERLAAKSA